MEKANESQFHFICGELKKTTFDVADFKGSERISNPYHFDITLTSKNFNINFDEVLNKPATLFILRGNQYFPYSGIVTEFCSVDQNPDFCTYRVHLVPKLWLTTLNKKSRIFQKKKVKDIINEILEEAGIESKDIDNRIPDNYPEHEYVVQYNESDLNFILRLMENYGFWYFFEEKPIGASPGVKPELSSEKLIITDNTGDFLEIPGKSSITFSSVFGCNERTDDENRESIHKTQFKKRIIPDEVFGKNYNYRTPELDLSGKAKIEGGKWGTIYEYGGNYKNTDEAETAVKILSRRIKSLQSNMEGAGNCRGFRAGCRFTLENHPNNSLNSIFLITQVTHTGGNLSTGNYTYHNQFSSVHQELIDYYVPQKQAVIPKVNGIITAMIEAENSDYAHLDDMGRYKIRLPFDISGKKNDCNGSKYIRMAQPYSGAKYGIHFPSHQGTEMVLACVNGDPDKPMGLGTIPNANTVSPVISENKHQNIIRTAGGNEFIMDDEDGKQKVRILTNNNNAFEMDDENKRIYLQSTDQNKILLDDQNESVSWNGGNHVISMSYKGGEEGIVINTADGHVIRIDDKNKRITIQSNGGNTIDLDDNGNKITLSDGKDKNTVTLDGSKGLILDTKGKLSINAAQDIEINSNANIVMSTSSGKVDLKAGQDMTISGLNINQKANANVKIEGLKIDTKGTTGVKMQGMNTELKGDVMLKLGGAMAELSGSGMTTVKGGIVMVN